jgi:hypothetical protein
MADAMSFKKDGQESKARSGYRNELVAERLTGNCVERFVSKAMKHGNFWESTARVAYEIATGSMVQSCGFAKREDIENFGSSSDGLVGNDGHIEIKCPTITTFTNWLRGGDVMPIKYIPQMTAQMAVSGRKWCDFVAFFPGKADVMALTPEDRAYFGTITLPEKLRHLRIKIWRFTPTTEELAAAETAASKFLQEVDDLFDLITRGE